ncbi:MAG: VanZ family protein [Ignavibacteria bacterium]|jgi:VanZ family protein|nr:VanZ family protein [Ignavibacteria bacterium]
MLKTKLFNIIFIAQLFIATGICIYCSSQEYIQLPDATYIDKIAHFAAYFIYGLSLQVFYITILDKRNITNKLMKSIVLITGILFAISDEIHQHFVPSRTADVLDVIADSIGIALSLLLYKYTKKIYTKILYN